MARQKRGGDTPGTRERILDTAERMFAQKGYAPVTMREIAAEAGVSLSGLPYHFGSKQELLRSVLDRRVDEFQAERAEGMRAALASSDDREVQLRGMVRALIQPSLSGDPARKMIGRMIGAVSVDPNPEVRSVMHDVLAERPTGLVQKIRELAGHLGDEEFYWRIYCLFGSMIYIQSDTGRMQAIAGDRFDFSQPHDNIDYILNFMVAGLLAPAGK